MEKNKARSYLDLLRKIDENEEEFFNLLYDLSSGYTLSLHRRIRNHPLFERAVDKISKYLEVEISGDKYAVCYSIGQSYFWKGHLEVICKRELELLSELEVRLAMISFAKFLLLTRDVDMQNLLLLISNLAKILGKDNFFSIELDENLKVLYFSHKGVVILNRIRTTDYNQYCLSIRFSPSQREIWVDSRNSRCLKRVVKRLSPVAIKHIILQISLL